jgi:TPR repeat protein
VEVETRLQQAHRDAAKRIEEAEPEAKRPERSRSGSMQSTGSLVEDQTEFAGALIQRSLDALQTGHITAAARLMQLAADLGHPRAMFFLGLWLCEGPVDGLHRDVARGERLIRLAAEAQDTLALTYSDLRGVFRWGVFMLVFGETPKLTR